MSTTISSRRKKLRIRNNFIEGEVKTVGTDIDKIMPPVSRFGGGNRAQKKQTIIDKLKAFFERYFGIGNRTFEADPQPVQEEHKVVRYDFSTRETPLMMVAEDPASYGEIGFYKALQIAKQTDGSVNHFNEYKNGYFFINDSEMESISDPGFAVAKKDGKVYHGIAAHEFLEGEIIKEGNFK